MLSSLALARCFRALRDTLGFEAHAGTWISAAKNGVLYSGADTARAWPEPSTAAPLYFLAPAQEASATDGRVR